MNEPKLIVYNETGSDVGIFGLSVQFDGKPQLEYSREYHDYEQPEPGDLSSATRDALIAVFGDGVASQLQDETTFDAGALAWIATSDCDFDRLHAKLASIFAHVQNAKECEMLIDIDELFIAADIPSQQKSAALRSGR